ncbi:MAG: hypothetical protein M1815_003689 [Lichina confinis]|nr:MAG: hypothetical protein M1815_003689 [Lichina confinis]
MDDTTDNLAENTVDNTADKTAKVPTKLGSKSQPKSQLKPKKPTHADNYMTVMSITKATDGTVLSLKDIFDQVLQDITKFEYQTRQGTFGGSKLTTPSRADAVTYLKPFRELFGLEGMHNLMAILTDLRASFEIHKHFAPGVVPDATTANTCVLPNSIKHLPADDVRCMIFQKIVLVETMETGVTRARYEKIFALTELSNLYNKLTNAMSKAELERLGYESGRGRGHQTLVKGFLIDLIWPEDNSPASRERQRQRLTNQLSISGFYQALMAEFGRGVLLMVPDTWTIKRLRSIPIVVFKHITATFVKLSPELRTVCEQVYSISSALEEGHNPDLLPIEANCELLENAMDGKSVTSLARIVTPAARSRLLPAQDLPSQSAAGTVSRSAGTSGPGATSALVDIRAAHGPTAVPTSF